MERLGRVLRDRYRIERELGQGGMATVYLATDLRQRRTVALKVLRPELASLIGPQRFLREIEISGKLNHPHIVPLFDAGDANGLPYYVMPFIEGESLRDRLRREQQLPIADALQITREVADALEYAHAQGIIHRDIKPENIMLSRGHALVADFGIARAVTAGGTDKLTGTGMAIGTADYMSPEQATGMGQVDGRSDLYSLACVLYEMLVGGPPFAASTGQAVIARHLVDPVPPIRTVRSTVPVPVEAAILAALAKSKADRFANVKEFVEALDGKRPSPSQPYPAAVAPRPGIGRHVLLGGAIVAPLALTLWLIFRGPPSLPANGATAGALDSNLVAVAPFNVLGRDHELFREGVMDILASELEGAGPLHTVSPSIVMQGWVGRADQASAMAVGRRTGARLVVYGSVVATGGDSVRLSARLLDVATGTASEVEVRDLGSRLDRVADSLAVGVLRELGRSRPIAAVPHAGFGSTSLPALKAYLAGERSYRVGNRDSALTYFTRAVELDSTFALAWRKMARVRSWGVGEADSLVMAYGLRAGALNHGLSLRDSLLVLAESLYAVPQSRKAVDNARRLHATLEEATRRFPEDPEAWSLLGRARVYSPVIGQTLLQTLEALDHAVRLDSSFAPAFDWHAAVQVSLRLDSIASARRHLLAATSWVPPPRSDGLRFAAGMLADPRAGLRLLDRWVDTASSDAIDVAAAALADWPDAAETAVRLSRALVGRRVDPPDSSVANWRLRDLAYALMRRGHLGEAFAIHPGMYFFAQAALFGGAPPDSVTAQAKRNPAAALAWFAQRRDTVALMSALRQLDSIARRNPRQGGSPAPAWDVARGRAYLALARGDTTGAINRFIPVIDSLCPGCSFSRTYTDISAAVPLLWARGLDQKAEVWLDYDNITVPRPVFDVWFALLRGRVSERLGKPEKAAAGYRLVAASWEHGDPELQVYVSEAREGLKRLGAGAVR